MRTVIHSYKMFKEGMLAFHPEEGHKYYESQKVVSEVSGYGTRSYLNLGFNLTAEWDFGDFVIERSREFDHGDTGRRSFISPVVVPNWVTSHNAHLFVQGLAAVLSFVTGRPVCAPSSQGPDCSSSFVEIEAYFRQHIPNMEAIKNTKVLIETEDGESLGAYIGEPRHNSGHPKLPDWTIWCTVREGVWLVYHLDHDGKVTDTDLQGIGGVSKVTAISIKQMHELALLSSEVVYGPGSAGAIGQHDIGNGWYQKLVGWKLHIDKVLEALYSLEYQAVSEKKLDYVKAMQVIRLVHQANQIHEEDFDLSFSLLVAAIEAMAQISAQKKGKSKDAELHRRLLKLIRTNEVESGPKGPLEAYYETLKSKISKAESLSSMFEKFVMNYCPLSDWEIEPHEAFDEQAAVGPIRDRIEIKPIDLGEDAKSLIADTYKYRSGFIHAGRPMPHKEPRYNLTQRYIECVIDMTKFSEMNQTLKQERRKGFTSEEWAKIEKKVLSHAALNMLARKSISNFILKAGSAKNEAPR